jgi:hypothetical protein
LPDLGQDLFQQEAGVLIAERVVLEAAVVRAPGVSGSFSPVAGVDEDADVGGISLVNQIVEDDRHAELAVVANVVVPVLEDHHREIFLPLWCSLAGT